MKVKNKVGGVSLLDFKTLCHIIKTLVLAKRCTNRSMKQNKETRNRSTYTHDQVTFYRVTYIGTQWGKKVLFSTNSSGTNGYPHCINKNRNKKSVDPYLVPYRNIGLKPIRNLNGKPKTIKQHRSRPVWP